MSTSPRILFFGGEPLGLPALESLLSSQLSPSLVFCNPDRPKGRGHILTPPPVKVFATTHGISVKQPSTFSNPADFPELTKNEWDLFVVVAYNFILPPWLLELPKYGVINVHPSLLPKLRGPSPIRTAILENQKDALGVSIMLLDEKMDHGPLLAQAPFSTPTWPLTGSALDILLAQAGAQLLIETIPVYLKGTITPKPQAHEAATYTKKLTKESGELTINPFDLPRGEAAQAALFKICAFSENPGAFFYFNSKRVKIKYASINADGILQLDSVIPEGKAAQPFTQYLQSLSNQ